MPSEHMARLFSLSLNQLPIAVVVMDEFERLVQWSPAAGELFALTDHQIESPISCIVPRHTTPLWQRLTKLARDRGEWKGELKLQTMQGEECVVEAHFAYQPLANGNIVIAFKPLTEIREQQKAELQAWRRRIAERLSTAMANELYALRDPTAHARAHEFELLGRAAETIVEQSDSSFNGWAVLLVGCSPVVRESLRLLLEARGMTVFVAAEGLEAAEIAEQSRAGIRVAVIDAELPGGGASWAIKAVRRNDPLLPVVILGDPNGKRIVDVIQASVPKPFRIEDVLWALSESQKAPVSS